MQLSEYFQHFPILLCAAHLKSCGQQLYIIGVLSNLFAKYTQFINNAIMIPKTEVQQRILKINSWSKKNDIKLYNLKQCLYLICEYCDCFEHLSASEESLKKDIKVENCTKIKCVTSNLMKGLTRKENGNGLKYYWGFCPLPFILVGS